MKAFGGTATKRAALKSALTVGSSHAAACGPRAFMAVHRDNAALMGGLLRSASLLTLASVKLPESVASALSADHAKSSRQTGNNVNKRKGNGFMAHSFRRSARADKASPVHYVQTPLAAVRILARAARPGSTKRPPAHGEADPLRCPKCSREGASFRSIDEEDVIERILRHLGLWQEGMRVHCGAEPPGETTLDPWLNNPFPDYDTEPVMAFSAT